MAMTTGTLRAALAGLMLVLVAAAVRAQDPPAPAARIALPQADVQWAGPDGTWRAADGNWPLGVGDRIRVGSGSRTEVQIGAHAAHLQGPAELEISALAADGLRLTLLRGSLNFVARPLDAGERVEIGTQNLALVAETPGEFRIDADPAGDSTRVAARSGSAMLFGENGESATLPAGQQALYVGRQLTATARQPLGQRDGLDLWAAQRAQAGQQSPSAQYVPRQIPGYQELDGQGEWGSTIEYGTVWYPRVPASGWAPYQHGRWQWTEPWGWTWIDDARWGFAPFQYGRWVQIGPRWAWAPGARPARPVLPPGVQRPEIPIRSTNRERPPAFAAPNRPAPAWAAEPNRRERWSRDQQDLVDRHQQQWRDQQARDAQRLRQEQWNQRQRQDQQQRQLQEPHRQHERFMREQRDALRARQDEQRQRLQQPRQPQPGEAGRRFGPRD